MKAIYLGQCNVEKSVHAQQYALTYADAGRLEMMLKAAAALLLQQDNEALDTGLIVAQLHCHESTMTVSLIMLNIPLAARPSSMLREIPTCRGFREYDYYLIHLAIDDVIALHDLISKGRNDLGDVVESPDDIIALAVETAGAGQIVTVYPVYGEYDKEGAF